MENRDRDGHEREHGLHTAAEIAVRMARGATVFVIAAVAGVGFVACGPEPLASVNSTQVVGEWAGTTSQAKAISFTVTSAGVTGATIGYQMQTGICTFSSTFPITTTEAMVVTDGKFTTGKTQIGQQVFVTASGEFTSSTEANGTILIQDAPCRDTLNLTWTATKQ
jgi:hypothetical protein